MTRSIATIEQSPAPPPRFHTLPVLADIADVEALVDLYLTLEARDDEASHAAADFIGDLTVLTGADGAE